MQKTGRNDPCQCGSQKKFKNCCLTKLPTFPSIDSDKEWQNFRKIEGKLIKQVLAFASDHWGPEIIVDGWDAFCLDEELEKNSPDGELLFPGWLIFRWIPFDYSKKWKQLGPNLTLADLHTRMNGLEEYAPFLFSVDQSPFSFFLVEDVIPSRRIILKDLFLDRTVTIKEQMGAIPEIKGTVVFGRLVFYEDQAFQISLGTTPLPLSCGLDVLNLKKEFLKREKCLTPTSLLKYDNDLRGAYLRLSESTRKPPEIRNNDGDHIVPCNLHYQLTCSPQIAFDHLVYLCRGQDPQEIILDGKFDKKGELNAISFPWLKNRTDLILGDVIIKENQLTIHVNSLERSRKIQKEIAKRLPEAFLKKEEREFLDLENIEKKRVSSSLPSEMEEEIAQAFFKDYYKNWLNTPLPALNGKTPFQAAKTNEGRERLELLLLDFEMSNQRISSHLCMDVQALRKELGLVQPMHTY